MYSEIQLMCFTFELHGFAIGDVHMCTLIIKCKCRFFNAYMLFVDWLLLKFNLEFELASFIKDLMFDLVKRVIHGSL